MKKRPQTSNNYAQIMQTLKDINNDLDNIKIGSIVTRKQSYAKENHMVQESYVRSAPVKEMRSKPPR